jgi:hypothetical protein
VTVENESFLNIEIDLEKGKTTLIAGKTNYLLLETK